MFEKYELIIIASALKRITDDMRNSKYVADADPHFLKCEALRAKAEGLAKGNR